MSQINQTWVYFIFIIFLIFRTVLNEREIVHDTIRIMIMLVLSLPMTMMMDSGCVGCSDYGGGGIIRRSLFKVQLFTRQNNKVSSRKR